MSEDAYRLAFERQKLAREEAEKVLEDKSRELYLSNSQLREAYEKLKQQKLQLIHQEKLASIGQLSAGVAHEINNPIGFLSSNLRSLKKYTNIISDFFSKSSSLATFEEYKSLQEKLKIYFIIEDIDDLINDCLEGTDRITTIVHSLKNFSRNEVENTEVFKINDCIKNTLRLVKSQIKYSASIEYSLDGDPNVIGNHGNLGQVLLNLIMNASHAIDVKRKDMPSLEGVININTEIKNNYVFINIKDNGTGISEEVLKKIFDPFFTTKAIGEGTGLGLSISQSIIRKMGGSLEVKTELGIGTDFFISLPMENKG